MAIKKARATYVWLPAKQWVYRASLVMMVIFGMTLLVMSRTNNPAISKVRTSITDIVTPILAIAASPMDAVHDAATWLDDMSRLREENLMLKNQNIQLLQWQTAAKTMEAENQALRAMLNVVPTQKSSYITAQIVSDLGGPYVHSALINAGSDNGIKKDEAIVNESGLIGRVVDVGANSARVLLLNDINSRVPVIGEKTHEKGILVGTNGDLPTLSYLVANSSITPGERIVTSGDGGIFPAGIPVGIVTSIDNGNVVVQPFVDATRVKFVNAVDYAF